MRPYRRTRPARAAARRDRRRAPHRSGRPAAAPPSGASGRSPRSDVLVQAPLLAPAPAPFQIVFRDRRLVDVVMGGALNVDRVDVLVLELARRGIRRDALDVVVETAVGAGLGAAGLHGRAGLVDFDVVARIRERGADGSGLTGLWHLALTGRGDLGIAGLGELGLSGRGDLG